MVKVIYDTVNDVLEIDDSYEPSIGESRQVTEFRQYVFNAMQFKFNNTLAALRLNDVSKHDNRWMEAILEVFNIADNCRFERVRTYVKDGRCIIEYKLKDDAV